MLIVDDLPSAPTMSRLLDAAAGDLSEHFRRVGPMPWRGASGRLIPDVLSSGLTGRGGAGAPTWRKLVTVAVGDRPVVIANAAAGEPAAAKDLALLSRCPHLVLDGLQLAVEAVGATAVYLYVKPGQTEQVARAALIERAAKAWDRYPVRVISADRGLLAGAESAVIARIAGRRGALVDGRPTLVQNVETLAHLSQIARNGADWFRRLGTPDEPGTFLATIGGPVAAPGVYEVPIATPAATALDLAGGPTKPLQALLIGGYHGTWIPTATLAHIPLSRATLAPLGAAPGLVLALPRSRCGLRETATILRSMTSRRHAVVTALEGLAGLNRPAGSLVRLSRMLNATHLAPPATLARSALATFDAEVRLHLHGQCSAGPAS